MGWLCRVGIGLDVWRCLFRTAVVEWGGACEDFFLVLLILDRVGAFLQARAVRFGGGG